jgi:hypothetical protein
MILGTDEGQLKMTGSAQRVGRRPAMARVARWRQRVNTVEDRGAGRHQQQDSGARRVDDVHRSEAALVDADGVVVAGTVEHDPSNHQAIWGIGYTPDKDVVRARMTLTRLSFSMEN